MFSLWSLHVQIDEIIESIPIIQLQNPNMKTYKSYIWLDVITYETKQKQNLKQNSSLTTAHHHKLLGALPGSIITLRDKTTLTTHNFLDHEKHHDQPGFIEHDNDDDNECDFNLQDLCSKRNVHWIDPSEISIGVSKVFTWQERLGLVHQHGRTNALTITLQIWEPWVVYRHWNTVALKMIDPE